MRASLALVLVLAGTTASSGFRRGMDETPAVADRVVGVEQAFPDTLLPGMPPPIDHNIYGVTGPES